MKQDEVMTADVAIIGGGVTGCAVAYYLRKAGYEVVIVEEGVVGGQASSAAAGLLAPLGPLSGPGPFADLLLASCASFPALSAELEEASGLKIGYERTGALRVVRSPKRIARLRKRFTSWEPLGLSITWLDRSDIERREPALAEDVCAAVYAPEEAQVDAARLVQAFAQADRKLGVSIYEHVAVSGLVTMGSRVTTLKTAHGGSIACNHVVIATGAWSAQLGTMLHYELPVRPVRGQMVSLRMPSSPLRHIIFGDATYVFPRGDTVLIGATKEEVGFDARTTSDGIAALLEVAYRLVPSLRNGMLERAWAGLRPGTPDSRPLLGPLPGWSNVLLATGHNSLGIALSPITGQSLAETITTGRVPDSIKPFSVARFV